MQKIIQNSILIILILLISPIVLSAISPSHSSCATGNVTETDMWGQTRTVLKTDCSASTSSNFIPSVSGEYRFSAVCGGSCALTCGTYMGDNPYCSGQWTTIYGSSGVYCTGTNTPSGSNLVILKKGVSYPLVTNYYKSDYCNYNGSWWTQTQVSLVNAAQDGVCGASAKSYGIGETFNTSNLCSSGTSVPSSPTLSNTAGATASWVCEATYGGVTEQCCQAIGCKCNFMNCTASRVSAPQNGACGSAAKIYAPTETFPSTNFCSIGTPSPTTPLAPALGGTSSWTCSGLNGGTPAPCTASRSLDGACGSSAKTYTAIETFDSVNLCSSGTAVPLNPSDPVAGGAAVTWICNGAQNGTNASCSASRSASSVNGACGGASRIYEEDETFDTSNFCLKGNADPIKPSDPLVGASSNWDCVGVNSGTTAPCSAFRNSNGACGDAAKKYLPSEPFLKDNLCSSGLATPVEVDAPTIDNPTVNWECFNLNETDSTTCTATRMLVDMCGEEINTVPSASSIFAGGSGTLSDPYLIATCTQLQNINNYLSSNFRISMPIDCAESRNWNNGKGFIPIGSCNGWVSDCISDPIDVFTGTLDGNGGGGVRNLYINRPNERVGLFGFLYYATIKNLAIMDANLSGSHELGGIAGYAYASTIKNSVVGRAPPYAPVFLRNNSDEGTGGLVGVAERTTIIDSNDGGLNSGCTACSGSTGVAFYADGYTYNFGGIVGKAINSTITNSNTWGDFSNTSYLMEALHVGGIAGYIEDSTLIRSNNMGYYPLKAYNDVGGIVGQSFRSKIIDCDNRVDINAESNYAGGIVGHAEESWIILSNNSGKVEGEYSVGGIVGYLLRSLVSNCNSSKTITGRENYTGGIIGTSSNSIVDFSENTGAINCYSDYCGGLVGQNFYSSIKNSRNFGNVTGLGDPVTPIGGIAGYFDQGEMINTQNYGSILRGHSYGGGIVGDARYSVFDGVLNYGNVSLPTYTTTQRTIDPWNAGGLFGDIVFSKISNSFNYGNVSAHEYVGGILGDYTQGLEMNNCGSFNSFDLSKPVISSVHCPAALTFPSTINNSVICNINRSGTLIVSSATTPCSGVPSVPISSCMSFGSSVDYRECIGPVFGGEYSIYEMNPSPKNNHIVFNFVDRNSSALCEVYCASNDYNSTSGKSELNYASYFKDNIGGWYDANPLPYEVNMVGGSTLPICRKKVRTDIPYYCTGLVSDNSEIFLNDDFGLTSDVARTLVDTNTPTKCQYKCSKGYYKGSGSSANTCLPYACSGKIDANALICYNDNYSLPNGTVSNILVNSLDDCSCNRKCEWYCKAGTHRGTLGTKDENTCISDKNDFSCTGNPPSFSIIWPNDNKGLIQNVPITLSSVNTPAKCEYQCIFGYHKGAIGTPQENMCVENSCSMVSDLYCPSVCSYLNDVDCTNNCVGDNNSCTLNSDCCSNFCESNVCKHCGNTVCESLLDENYISCPSDCPPPVCVGFRSNCLVASDCCSGVCVSGLCEGCGNTLVTLGENCSNCSDAFCKGDQICNGSYFCVNPSDLNCGNRLVDVGESCSTCPSDVKCDWNQSCVKGICSSVNSISKFKLAIDNGKLVASVKCLIDTQADFNIFIDNNRLVSFTLSCTKVERVISFVNIDFNGVTYSGSVKINPLCDVCSKQDFLRIGKDVDITKIPDNSIIFILFILIIVIGIVTNKSKK